MLDELHDKTKEYGTLDKLSAPMKREYTAKLQEWREKIKTVVKCTKKQCGEP